MVPIRGTAVYPDEWCCANAEQMLVFLASVVSLHRSLSVDGGFVCCTSQSKQVEMGQQFHFCRGFICCYSCSQAYSAWSKVWVLNVLPETAGRLSVRVCLPNRVWVCVCLYKTTLWEPALLMCWGRMRLVRFSPAASLNRVWERKRRMRTTEVQGPNRK